jgi:hypothetical protein
MVMIMRRKTVYATTILTSLCYKYNKFLSCLMADQNENHEYEGQGETKTVQIGSKTYSRLKSYRGRYTVKA